MTQLGPGMSVRNSLWTVAALVIIVAGLKAAGPVLVPFLVAVFLSLICAPAVRALRNRRVPNLAAVLLVLLGLMALLVAAGAVFAGTINEFSREAPKYEELVSTMAHDAGSLLSGSLGGRLGLTADKLFSAADPGAIMSLVGTSMEALAAVMSNAVLVILTIAFILLEASSIPVKIRLLAGHSHADISGFGRIAKDVQRYLAIKTGVAIATGTLVGVWAAVLDVDFAVLWGLLAFMLNYIPNIGVMIAAVPAVLLALVQHGVGTALALGVGYLVVGMVVGNAIEPALMGRRLGLSTLVVFLSLVVWGWLWGSVGMLLSVPLTMVLKIMLESSNRWSPWAILLDTPEETTELAEAAAAGKAPPTSPLSLQPPPPAPSTEEDDADEDW
ncbi:MAG: AI-2E family transporter [Deltaproteobacteria bacterium]|jgi:predicted PurR-regulated permease PerM|nr:AI-2E family transporter [Deltaproteobacteria bacterium]MBW2535371.1 AI-2E family transporter [Deltaproteobacteria bacterium]